MLVTMVQDFELRGALRLDFLAATEWLEDVAASFAFGLALGVATLGRCFFDHFPKNGKSEKKKIRRNFQPIFDRRHPICV